MSMQIHTRRKWGGYVGLVVCVIRGRRIWSESSGIVRPTREDARKDGEWLREQQDKAGREALS